MGFSELVAATDRAVQDHLGSVTARYTPEFEDPIEIAGMFDPRYVLIDPDHAGVEQVTPMLFVREADLLVDPDDDEPELEIDGVTYQVVERMPDGQGGIRLRLHRSE